MMIIQLIMLMMVVAYVYIDMTSSSSMHSSIVFTSLLLYYYNYYYTGFDGLVDGKSACIPSASLAICLYAMLSMHTLCCLSTLSLSLVTHVCMCHRMTGSLWCTVERGPSGQHQLLSCTTPVCMYGCMVVCMVVSLYCCMRL
jgi:hypothetical protein